MSTKSEKRAYRKSNEVRAAVLVALLDGEKFAGQVAAEVDMPYQSVTRVMKMLEAEGTIAFVGVEEVVGQDGSVSRGRPRHMFKLSDNGRKAAKRVLAKATA